MDKVGVKVVDKAAVKVLNKVPVKAFVHEHEFENNGFDLILQHHCWELHSSHPTEP